MSKEIFVIRHGQTDFNLKGIVQGRGINSDLNETGMKQARMFFDAFRHVPFDKIYTSTLKRTHQTVQPFIEHYGEQNWEQHEGFDELDWGEMEGRTSDDETKHLFHQVITRWRAGDLNHAFNKGEHPLEVQMRQKKALDYILSKSDEQRVLICMHGRAIRIFLSLLLNTPLSEMDNYPHNNLSLYKLRYEANNFELLLSNDTSHLSEW
jgi:broad specificity phosphatase PhoE